MASSSSLALTITHQNLTADIHLEGENYICLNDLVQFFPEKRLYKWRKSQNTQEYIDAVEKILNEVIPPNGGITYKAIYTIKGNFKDGKKQGTYAHELIALEFLAWLSPEFKLKVFVEWNKWRKEVLEKKPQLYNFDELIVKLKEVFVTKNEFNLLLERLQEFSDYTMDKLDSLENRVSKLELQPKILSKAKPYFVYLMYNPDRDLYKIGHSGEPINRQKTFHTVNANIKIIHTLILPSKEKAVSLERYFKSKFSDKNIEGEWFKLGKEDVDYIKNFKI